MILDENTSGDASRYEASKGYFKAISDAGGLPFGIPYLPEIVAVVIDEFEGLLCVGGRFAYPDSWYLAGKPSKAPPSERLVVERAIVLGAIIPLTVRFAPFHHSQRWRCRKHRSRILFFR